MSSLISIGQESKIQKDIKILLEMTGSAKLGVQVANQMITSFKTTYPDIPDKFWSDFMEELEAEDLNSIIIPIYEKYYNHKDIKKLIKFYKSPIGKKNH
jgi:uncharacterized protein